MCSSDLATFGKGMQDAMVLRSAVTYEGPTTCEQAAMTRSYIGCDYWPTVTANPVWSIFDYTVVVANTQGETATVTVTGPGGIEQITMVPENQLAKIYLPWVKALKGPDANTLLPCWQASATRPTIAGKRAARTGLIKRKHSAERGEVRR